MSEDINVVALVKGSERYIFLYDDDGRRPYRTLGRYASNPELSFSWYDAAILSQKIRRQARQSNPIHNRVFVTGAHDGFRNTVNLLSSLAGRRFPPRVVPLRNPLDLTMQRTLDRFLRFLVVERNASALTIKSYREDLTALVDYLADDQGNCPELAGISRWSCGTMSRR